MNILSTLITVLKSRITRLVAKFRLYTSRGFIQARIIDKFRTLAGKILNIHKAELGKGIVRAACVVDGGAYYVLQDGHYSGTARMVRVDQANSEAQPAPLKLPEAPAGQILVVRDLYQPPEDFGHIYLSAYFCETEAQEGYSNREEVQDAVEYGFQHLDFHHLRDLSFEAPDYEKTPCLALAMDCARAGGLAPCVMSAANEVAVHAFLRGELGFNRIYDASRAAVEALGGARADDLDTILEADRAARNFVTENYL